MSTYSIIPFSSKFDVIVGIAHFKLEKPMTSNLSIFKGSTKYFIARKYSNAAFSLILILTHGSQKKYGVF